MSNSETVHPISVAKDPYGKLIRTVHHRHGSPVAIEAGHIYADQRGGQEQANGLVIAAEIGSRLAAAGIAVHRIIFIDDYNAAATNFCLEDYLEFAAASSFVPDTVFWESGMVDRAAALIEQLTSLDQVRATSGQELVTAKHKIRLRHSDGRLTCAVLDAAFHQQRFERFGFNITVLPTYSDRFAEHNYQHQQRNLRRLLGLLGYDQLPLANVFFDQQRSFSVVLH